MNVTSRGDGKFLPSKNDDVGCCFPSSCASPPAHHARGGDVGHTASPVVTDRPRSEMKELGRRDGEQAAQGREAGTRLRVACPVTSEVPCPSPCLRAKALSSSSSPPNGSSISCLPRLISCILYIFKVVIIFIVIFIVAGGASPGPLPTHQR